jgi:hypothetical protein
LVVGPKKLEEATHGVSGNTETSAEHFGEMIRTGASATGSFLKAVGGAIVQGVKAFEDWAKPTTFDPNAQD